ncbi:MAG TPA: hypothetical protein VFE24_15065 [Pirellulales bacterium]|jgi:hypothetical protein|nr:hypothetical protein [Pirellulales bacterium]
MDARLVRLVICLGLISSLGASYRTANFVIEAPTPQLAEEIGRAAEHFRHDLAIEWIGEAMPNWTRPCPIHAQVEPKLGAGGATSFVFDHGEVFGWTMNIQGSRERVLDSVLPHEVTHTIFASHFRQPLPRWADEGACTTVEHESEKHKQAVLLINFLQSNRGIAFNQMFAMKEYPKDVIPLYAQGYSLANFFIEQGGRRKFVNYVGEGLKAENWPVVTKKFYGFGDLSELQTAWLEWVKRGSPNLEKDSPPAVASAERLLAQSPDSHLRYRGQSPDSARPPLADAPLTPLQPNPANEPELGYRNGGDGRGSVKDRDAISAPPVESEPNGGRYLRQNGFSQPASRNDTSAVVARRPTQVVFEWSAE